MGQVVPTVIHLMMNDALRKYIQSETEPLEDTLRKVIREELKLAK